MLFNSSISRTYFLNIYKCGFVSGVSKCVDMFIKVILFLQLKLFFFYPMLFDV